MQINLENLSKKDAMKLLAVILLSDGYFYHRPKHTTYIQLGTLDSSLQQHVLFEKLCLKIFHSKPRKHTYKRYNQFTDSKYYITESRLTVTKYVKDFFELSPTFKTTPGPSKINDYLSLKQPSIQFLFNEPDYMKKLALSIWFDFDGSINPVFKLKNKHDKKKGKIYHYYQIQFECEVYIAETNPTIVKELLYFCNLLGLKARIKYDKRNWSGIEGIVFSDLDSIKKFVKIGPATNIAISNKGNKLTGITKQDVCGAVDEILTDNTIPKSCYFKNKDEAEAHRLYLKALFKDKLRNRAPSSSGQKVLIK